MNTEKKYLKIKGTILDKEQLENYLEKLAASYEIKVTSEKQTYPIIRLNENFKFIEKTYNLLNEHIKKDINMYAAGEWLLDNFYVIEEAVKRIAKEMSIKKYIKFPSIANGTYKGYARIYVIANEIIAYTDSKITDETLFSALFAYERKKTLSMEEIWNLWIFLEISIIENIRTICEKIYSSQMQKYKVESIVERIIEKKELSKQQFKRVREENKVITKEMRYPFIEYMSYKLKKYGKQGIAYLNVLEEQINKMGMTASEVIKKEHFDIAIQKVSIGNSITSIREISRIDFLNLFEEINGVEEILRKDPAQVYSKMDYKTKEYYRNKIKEISDKTKISETYIAKMALELAENSNNTEKKAHIGYYLISDGIYKLYQKIDYKKTLPRLIPIKYIYSIYLLTSLFVLIFLMYMYKTTENILLASITAILSIIPISEIYVQILNWGIVKKTKPKLIPKLDFTNGIPKKYSTVVVIPTIINNSEKVKEVIKKMEIYYCANFSDNIYFALLGDCTASDKQQEITDEDIIKTGIEETERLNKKYGEKFYFLYRNRVWNDSEQCYLGWERKRGLLCQFNDFIVNNNNEFRVNTIKKIDVKYAITLDSDTNLCLDTAFELVGAMAHILNIPVIDKNRKIVTKGHALIQPRVGIDLNSSRKSLFSKIYAGLGGTDSYANAVSDIYEDCFDEGIFTGKGIYDIKIFHELLSKEIPENTVLSHDLLEGSYLRCGFASDILLLDGFPAKYNSYIARLHRWTRGDWQIFQWLKYAIKIKNGTYRRNPLNKLSKFKILDNLRRSLIPVSSFIALFFSFATENLILGILSIISLTIPTILDLVNYIVFRKNIDAKFVLAHKNIIKVIGGMKASIIRGLLEIALLPNKAYWLLNAILKTIYRITKSKKHLLEWTTAEETERQAKDDLSSYFKNMSANVIMGTIAIIYGIILDKLIVLVLGIFWGVAPIVAWRISKPEEKKEDTEKINKGEKKYILDIGAKTWRFFEENINEKNNYLPPDNYQEDRKEKVANRTSPTNIGLGLLAVCSAYDLKYINGQDTIKLISKMLNTIAKLQKIDGHLYNWYNTITLEPLIPRYISTVDSGNFVGYLYTLKQFLLSISEKNEEIKGLLEITDNLIKNTDFSMLYDNRKRLFSIGFNVEENKLTDSYYDLLASEARQASFIAIAKKNISPKHWGILSRTLTSLNRYKGLISWSGTTFEYLMPNINIQKYEGSLLDESCRFMIMSQIEYAKKLGIPWGISEAAFNLRDLNNNYQYKAFGIPWLGLKRGLEEDMVISPYSVFLSLEYEPKLAVNNLKLLEEQGMVEKYGFYESIDYTFSRLKYGENNSPVKAYMAHHQGLILLSINNFLNKRILVKRFMGNPEIEAIDILLQERMPEKAIITKEKKEKIQKLKTKDYENYSEKIYLKPDLDLNISNVISNGNYTVCTKIDGQGFSKQNNILINRFKETSDYKQGNFFYIKNLSSKKLWNSFSGSNCKVTFTPDMTRFSKTEGNIEAITKIGVSPDDSVEIRRLELKNIGNETEILEITNYFEPVLSTPEQDYAHPAFNNLFLVFELLEDRSILIKRKKRGSQNDIYAGAKLYTESETIGDDEYELDREKFMGYGNAKIPMMIEDSKRLSKNLGFVTDPILAMKKTIKIQPKEKIFIDLIICMEDNKETVQKTLKKYSNANVVTKTFELSRAKTEAESIYLGVTGKDIEKYQKMLGYLIFQNPLKKVQLKSLPKKIYSQSDLWKYGMSGDLPILLVRIKDINDMYIIEDVLKAYEFFRAKNVKIDLVILNEEINSYEHFLKYEIENAIQNRQIAFLKNTFAGIFVINKKEILKEDIDLLLFRANLIIDGNKGNIELQLKDLEEDYKSNLKNISLEENRTQVVPVKENLEEDYSKLKYYNEYGGFSENGLEYKFKISNENKLPTAWSLVLTNKDFGTIVTQNLGGFTWSKNSRLNRVSAWTNSPNTDIPSEIIYMKDKTTGQIWNLSENLNTGNQEYNITFGFGYVVLKTIADKILQELEIFVPEKDKAKINILHMRNMSGETKKLKMVYYIKPVLCEDEQQSNGYIEIDKEKNIVIVQNLFKNDFKNEITYITSSENIKSFTGSKKFFIGEGTIDAPQGLDTICLDNSSGLGESSCVAIEIEIELKEYEDKEISIVLGNEESILDAKNIGYKYSNVLNCREELNNVKNFWYELLTRVQVKTPLESMNIILNGWAVYQTITSRLWAKTGYYQSGGATGFRDQLQDTLGLKYIDINFMKYQIIKQAKHQFIEGDVEHWWHEETRKGIRTRFSDDLLWLCYVTSEYIEYTGDYEFLNTKIPYLEGNELEDTVDEKYDLYEEADVEEDLYSHCIKAIERSLNLGENGLPKIGSGDWNDGLNTVGNKRKGESIWLGFFLYDVLGKFITICKYRKDREKVKKYEDIRERLRKTLNIVGWDGRWFKRAFTDDGDSIRKY